MAFGPALPVDYSRLLIIVKSRSSNGVCYIGLDMDRNELVRPILRTETSRICWSSSDPVLRIGHQYLFRVIRRHPEEIPHPHRANDILVEYVGRLVVSETHCQCGSSNVASLHKDIYSILLQQSRESVIDVFGNLTSIRYGGYVEEGTNCPSFGIYRCKRFRQIARPHKQYSLWGSIQLRCQIDQSANGGIPFDYTITALDFEGNIPASDEDDVLLILGLGRPLEGNRGFFPRRCYILVVGFVKVPSLF